MATASTARVQEQFTGPVLQNADGCHNGEAVTLREYLSTTYHPDCDYVDGHLQERNFGDFDHATLQAEILFLLTVNAAEWNIEPLPELRLQVSATNFRIPDIMVLRADHNVDRIVREAPLLCIEVLSPEDTFKRLNEKVADYLTLGVQHIWAFDPSSREAYLCDANGFHKIAVPELTVPGTPIRVALSDVFRTT